MQMFPNEGVAENHQTVLLPCVIKPRKKKQLTGTEGWLPPSKTQVIVG